MSLHMMSLHSETGESCPDLSGKLYRASFHTRSSAKGPRKKIYRAHLDGEGPRKGEHAVVKVFREAPGKEPMCDAEIAKHVMARKMARKFNKMLSDSSDKIKFTLPLKSTVEKFGMGTYLFRHSRHLDKQEWVLIEENLLEENEDTKFEVFLRKSGERAVRDPTSLDAFVHFTFLESGQHFVMAGFQGVHTREEGYKLTTPCLHSARGKLFGQTDKGPSGLRAVFAKHRCNNLCYLWPKPQHHPHHHHPDQPPSAGHHSDDPGTDSATSSGDEVGSGGPGGGGVDREDSSVAFTVLTPMTSEENCGALLDTLPSLTAQCHVDTLVTPLSGGTEDCCGQVSPVNGEEEDGVLESLVARCRVSATQDDGSTNTLTTLLPPTPEESPLTSEESGVLNSV